MACFWLGSVACGTGQGGHMKDCPCQAARMFSLRPNEEQHTRDRPENMGMAHITHTAIIRTNGSHTVAPQYGSWVDRTGTKTKPKHDQDRLGI